MRELLRWLLGASGETADSKETARQRLRLVLIQDRLDLPPEKMEQMKREIWEVVSRYMVVEDDFMEFEVRRLDELLLLVSNIQVKDLNGLTPPAPALSAAGKPPPLTAATAAAWPGYPGGRNPATLSDITRPKAKPRQTMPGLFALTGRGAPGAAWALAAT